MIFRGRRVQISGFRTEAIERGSRDVSPAHVLQHVDGLCPLDTSIRQIRD